MSRAKQFPVVPQVRSKGGHAIVGGHTYGQGSSREHAALAPRYLSLRVVIAKDFARIHWQNLINFGIRPLTFENTADYDAIEPGDTLQLSDLPRQLRKGQKIAFENTTKKQTLIATHNLSERQTTIVLAGGLLNWVKSRLRQQSPLKN